MPGLVCICFVIPHKNVLAGAGSLSKVCADCQKSDGAIPQQSLRGAALRETYAEREAPMPFSLLPNQIVDRYGDITPESLRKQGITLLLSDLDYTLAARRTARPDQALRDWIAALRAAGIQFMIVSNNRTGTRVTEFCADLGVPYQGRAGKPSPRGLEAAMNRTGVDRAHTAMLGDKLLTDMLAANRAGVLALMVEPVGGAVTLLQKALHALQSPFKAACRRKLAKNKGRNREIS